MKQKLTFAIAAVAFVFSGLPAWATVEIGKAVPNITTTDTNGNPFNLADHKGKVVVLEWTNHQCPFVIKHYETNNMQNAQKTAREHGVEWVSIVSSAPGRQGHLSAEEANAIATKSGATISAKILDETGEIGKAFGAQTTPHMYVIDTNGHLAYAGAIDDNSSPNPKTVEGATNYVLAAINDLKAGNAVQTAQTKPYGCSVKY